MARRFLHEVQKTWRDDGIDIRREHRRLPAHPDDVTLANAVENFAFLHCHSRFNFPLILDQR